MGKGENDSGASYRLFFLGRAPFHDEVPPLLTPIRFLFRFLLFTPLYLYTGTKGDRCRLVLFRATAFHFCFIGKNVDVF